MALINKLTAIADAIRTKTGGTATMSLDQMVTAINGLTTGVDHTQEDGLLTGTLTSYTNNRVTSLMNNVFYNRKSLAEVSFPEVVEIGNSAFYYCSALTGVSFPKATKIGSSAFRYCSALTGVSFPKATKIDSYAFSRCSALTGASFPEVTAINMSSFEYCDALTELDFSKIKVIGYAAFERCTSLNSLILRSTTVCTLGSSALKDTPIEKGEGIIYVPDNLLSSYNSATNWSMYVSQTMPLSMYPIGG